MKNIKKGIYAYNEEISKFKNTLITFRFVNEITKENACIRTLLALMLANKSKKYATKKLMMNKKDNLYNAKITRNIFKVGKLSCINIELDVISNEFVDNDNYQNEYLEFFKEVIMNPLFDEENLKEAKLSLKSKYLRLIDEPSTFADKEITKILGKNQPYGYDTFGVENNTLNSISLDDIQIEYKRLIEEDNIYLNILGANANDELADKVLKCFDFKDRKEIFEANYDFKINEIESEYIIEKDISQATILVNYKGALNHKDKEKFYAFNLAVNILGGASSSLLFQEVREKHSLCYSIYARQVSYEKLMTVKTGVALDKIDKAIELIKIEVDKLKNGEFDEQLFDTIRILMINSLSGIKDDLYTYLNYLFTRQINNLDTSIDNYINGISQVSKQDVIASFDKIEFLTTLIIRGENDDKI